MIMAATSLSPCSVGILGSWAGCSGRRRPVTVCYARTSTRLAERYRTLRIQPGATETEVKRAFRQLALKYHPDVCQGRDCGVQFHQINEAYEMVMDQLRESKEEEEEASYVGRDGEYYEDETMRGMYDSSWDLWEEWMGWEGAGIRDYTSHINPYT